MQRIVLALISACIACGSLVGTDYAGEPLLRLQGIASTAPGTSLAIAGVKGATYWQAPDPMTGAFTRLPMHIEFPTFWIDVMASPRPQALFRLDASGPLIGEASLHIVKPDTGSVPSTGDILATDYQHVLVYVSDELPPDGLTAMYLGAALAPGFHVMSWSSTVELTAPQQVLAEQCIAAAPAPAEHVRIACRLRRLYRLTPTPDDLETVLRFHLGSTSR